MEWSFANRTMRAEEDKSITDVPGRQTAEIQGKLNTLAIWEQNASATMASGCQFRHRPARHLPEIEQLTPAPAVEARGRCQDELPDAGRLIQHTTLQG
jgi:hypothetical protein